MSKATRKQLIDRWKTEPGAAIQRKLDAWVLAQAQGNWTRPDSGELFAMLDGLPLRDEVAGGRDLRGSGFAGARKRKEIQPFLQEATLSWGT